MGADVLAWLGDVAVTVWGRARSTFTWTDLMPLAAILVSLWVLKQNKASREVAEDAKAAAEEANRIARGSNTLAEKANGIAERMEALARQANEVAERALTTGEGAKEAAIEANDIARAANDLAKEANDLFKQQNERETERHDVRWEGEFVEPGVYRLTNKGDHTAHKVEATVRYYEQERRVNADEVLGGGFLEFEFSDAKQEYDERKAGIALLQEQKRDRARARAEPRRFPMLASNNDFMGVQSDYTDDRQIDQFRMIMERVVEYVQWKTARGTEKVHDEAPMLGHLGGEL
ncbi:methyl-accepting chemotaxis domain-containing protein [Nocardiopsis metallicus]|uniref:Putative transcriptional regulator n=1 Tax=Nocardiopsis metallicus TaxID=179819 RepID=A0A840WMJ6_9ACTN|nr:hypothetical protein [Nocardiopsis metallicus]MBB5491338.1 putative transcriptional regulator [Nocardiopsis metallicus]